MLSTSYSVVAVSVALGATYGPQPVDPPSEISLRAPPDAGWVLDYDPAIATVWRDVTRSAMLPAGTAVDELFWSVFGDLDGDGSLTAGDWRLLYGTFGSRSSDPSYSATCDLTGDGVINVADAAVLMQSVASPMRVYTVYVDVFDQEKGLARTVHARPGAGGVQDGPITPMSAFPPVNISPTSGRLGTTVTITMGTSPPTFVFDPQTTATWLGKYVPMVGSPTANFQVSFNAQQFREFSQGQAIVVIGDGAISGAPNPEALNGPGTLQGTLTLHLSSGVNVARSFNFALETDANAWHDVLYPDGFGGSAPPEMSEQLFILHVYQLSLLPNPTTPSQTQLLYADDYHVAAVVKVAENPTTLASAPSTALVDLVSYNAAGSEIDRVSDLTVHKLTIDNDPMNIIYHNNLTRPITIVDTVLNKANYPLLVILRGIPGGTVVVVPAN